jgi:hypothetical protein
VKHYHGNKTFIKLKKIAKKPCYPMHDRTKGVDEKCKCKKGLVKRASNV